MLPPDLTVSRGMSKSRRVYAGIMVAAVGGLIVDMTLLRGGSPSPASAGVAQQQPSSSELEEALAQLREHAPSRRSALAEALDLLGTNAPMADEARNAFGLPASMRAVVQVQEQAQEVRADDADRNRLRVSSVVMGQRPVALINGRIYAAGDTIEPQGWKVRSIDRGGVEVEREGRTMVIELATGR